ncbi:hypothetical protein [Paraburkholderia aromaticivorans]|uniref:AraC-like ligand-binding domain-containing protein n=1 Tax=Paraburkholderia aromaticivorans TaxID=2026199 RepID=UPI001FC97F8F|nr:hypothetical protein [Paraburkholderia aromaticivorans]
MFCVSGSAEVNAAGRTIEVNDRQGVVRAPGESFSAKLSPDCEQLSCYVSSPPPCRTTRHSARNRAARSCASRTARCAHGKTS